MNKKLEISLIGAALSLVACGSPGVNDQGYPVAFSEDTVREGSVFDKSSGKSNVKTDANDETEGDPGISETVDGYSSSHDNKNAGTISGEKYTEVVIGGQAVSIKDDKLEGKFKGVRYGTIHRKAKENSGKRVYAVYAHGNTSNSIPKKGSATYVGEAFGAKTKLTESEFEKIGWAKGTANLSVDFEKGSVVGKLSDWKNQQGTKADLDDLNIKATISGTTFKGDSTTGRFYGTKGALIGGVYNDSSTMAGFGGHKKK